MAQQQALQVTPPPPRLPKPSELEIWKLSVKLARRDRDCDCHWNDSSGIGDDGFDCVRGCICVCDRSTETWQNVTWN